jgi:uncharacterized coiled-coil protein SlyX
MKKIDELEKMVQHLAKKLTQNHEEEETISDNEKPPHY